MECIPDRYKLDSDAGSVLSFLGALMPSLKLADGQGNDQDQDDSQSGQPLASLLLDRFFLCSVPIHLILRAT